VSEMGFSEELQAENRVLWDKILGHQFIVELGSGMLPLEKFTYYVKQDYLYLVDFARCIGLAAVKAGDVEDMRGWAGMMEGCLRYEMDMLEDISGRLGISKAEIVEAERAPTNLAYLNHLLGVAYSGAFGEIVSSLLPCMWTYVDVGVLLSEMGGYRGHPVYMEWCEAYGASEYSELVQAYIDALDGFAVISGKYMRDRMRDCFHRSLRYEYLFWEMAYNMEQWMV